MKQSGDWLSALTVMGRILTLTPFIAGMVILLFDAVGGVDIGERADLEGDPYALGVLFLCGVVTLIYVAIKRFQEGLRGKKEPGDR